MKEYTETERDKQKEEERELAEDKIITFSQSVSD